MSPVVVPTYRRPHALSHLVGALERQTLPIDRFEVVIVDNASPDDTSARLAELAASSPLRLRHLVERERGPAATRNTGWRAATAPFVAFIDDDCLPERDWLRAGLAAETADDRIGVVQGCTRKRDDAPLGDWTLWRQITAPTPYFEGCNIFYRRAAPRSSRLAVSTSRSATYGEDAALGWSVMGAGWQRGYAEDAFAYHDVEERGLRYHVRTGLVERNVAPHRQASPRVPTRGVLAPVGVPARERGVYLGCQRPPACSMAPLSAHPGAALPAPTLPPPEHPRRAPAPRTHSGRHSAIRGHAVRLVLPPHRGALIRLRARPFV